MSDQTKHPGTGAVNFVHIITGLPVGGAQSMLSQIVRCQQQRGDRLMVITLTELGAVGEQLRTNGINVIALRMNRLLPDVIGCIRLAFLISKFKPDVVQTWMYHADFIGGIIARLMGIKNVVWNIRHSNLQPSVDKKVTIWIAHLCGWLSRLVPRVILCNSRHAARLHKDLGYDYERIEVIPNGIDTEKFYPQPGLGISIRRELNIDRNTKLIGLIARFDKQKDHRSFIAAAEIVVRKDNRAHFLLCGENIDRKNEDLSRWINATSCQDHFHLLGLRRDVPRVTAALDLSVSSSSHGEGFSNVIAEAMACGVPCVVTDIGDSAWIVSDTGWCVPPEDEKTLAKAICIALSEPAEANIQRSIRSRKRIINNFSIDEIFEKYQRVYDRLLKK